MSQNNNTTIVACWWGFVDIDGLACTIAYAELLRLEWTDACAVLSDPLNASVTPEIRAIATGFSQTRTTGQNYVIVDMSDPEKIQEFAPIEKVTEVYDHHFGFEEYWRSRLGERAKIEPIGAAATLIWEEFKTRGFADSISNESATLLAHAIISNTVCFLVGLSSERDKAALGELVEKAQLPKDWIASYFHAQQTYMEQNPEESILNDTKFLTFPAFGNIAFWQAEIWDSTEFLNAVAFDRILDGQRTDAWIFNCIDIRTGETRVHSNHPEILERIGNAFDGIRTWNSLHLKRVVLRKEILPILRADNERTYTSNGST